MEQVRSVSITEAIVRIDSETRKPLGSVLLILRRLGVLIAQASTVSVVSEQRQAQAQFMLIGRLEGVVATLTVRSLVGRISSKIRVRHIILRVCAWWQNYCWRIVISQV